MVNQIKFQGIIYNVEPAPWLDGCSSNQKSFVISTTDEIYPRAKRAITSIIGNRLGYFEEELWSRGEWILRNKKEPSIFSALHPYYKFSFDKEINAYIWTFVQPNDE